MNPAVVKSDYIRLGLLKKFGGIWMDATNVLVKDLDALHMEEFVKSEQTVAGYVMAPYASKKSPIVNNKPVDGLENWLLIAKPGSPLIQAWKTAFTHYWKTRPIGQHIHLHPMYNCKGFDFGGMSISDANYLNQHAALKYILFKHPELGKEIFPLDFNPWWVHMKAQNYAGEDEATRIYNLVTGNNRRQLAAQAIQDGVVFLKFGGGHIKQSDTFRTANDYCRVENFYSLLFPDCHEVLK